MKFRSPFLWPMTLRSHLSMISACPGEILLDIGVEHWPCSRHYAYIEILNLHKIRLRGKLNYSSSMGERGRWVELSFRCQQSDSRALITTTSIPRCLPPNHEWAPGSRRGSARKFPVLEMFQAEQEETANEGLCFRMSTSPINLEHSRQTWTVF